MTPVFYQKEKTLSSTPSESADTHLVLWVVSRTLIGGILAALAALVFHQKDLSFGLFFGCLAAALNCLGLNRLTKMVLRAGRAKGQKLFWVWNSVRWLGFALVCGMFLSISKRCFLGGLSSYFWFLVVLTWTGLRMAPLKKHRDE